MMTLFEAIRDLDLLNLERTIYAAEPWSVDSKVVVTSEPNTGVLPAEAQKLELKYFLEVIAARNFLDDWTESLGIEPATRSKVDRLIKYAIAEA